MKIKWTITGRHNGYEFRRDIDIEVDLRDEVDEIIAAVGDSQIRDDVNDE